MVMFIDLKQNTPEDERLNTGIFDGCNVEVGRLIEDSRDTMVGGLNSDEGYIRD